MESIGDKFNWLPDFKVFGGMSIGEDGYVHTTFTHNPSTLRLSSVEPNLQNIPRGNDSVVQAWVKQMFVAPEGQLFWARDYSGIEAVLVGYFCGSRDYYRLAKLGVHAFFASHVLGRPIDLAWSDADISLAVREIKKNDKVIYDTCKRCVHLSNYKGTPGRMFMEYPETFRDYKDAKYYQDFYYDLFPDITSWHKNLCRQVDGTRHRSTEDLPSLPGARIGAAHVRNPFGFLHRFYRVLDWEKIDGEWIADFGSDSKKLIAFLPQSTAAGIIYEAGMDMFYNHFESIGQTMRLFIHDEIFGLAHKGDVEAILDISKDIMEREFPELPLDPSWKMGSNVCVATEAKVGPSWGAMK